jgi:hypothetical protein
MRASNNWPTSLLYAWASKEWSDERQENCACGEGHLDTRKAQISLGVIRCGRRPEEMADRARKIQYIAMKTSDQPAGGVIVPLFMEPGSKRLV